jgi:FtsP/CotA-like multicopper oxidase with cupredoxin domain
VLRPLDPLPPATVQRSFRFERGGGQWVVNGEAFDPDRTGFQAKLGAVEAWTFENHSGGWLHPIHTHDVPFRVLRHGGAPPPWEGGEKDTVAIGHGDSATVTMQFVDFVARTCSTATTSSTRTCG